MPVLVEAISVIIKKTSIMSKFNRGWFGFKQTIPNNTFCEDGDLVRVGFMMPNDVGRYIQLLEMNGLIFVQDLKAVDIVVVDQMRGPTLACDWIDVKLVHVFDGDIKIVGCGLKGSTEQGISVPDGWKYENSISASPNFVPNEQVDEDLEFLRVENGMKVFGNKKTGKEVYIGSPTIHINEDDDRYK